MIKMDIKVTGLDELIKKLDVYNESNLNGAIEGAMDSGASLIYGTLLAKTPVKTGNLRASERIEKEKLLRRIGPDISKASYAPFVEFGHHTRSGSFVPGQFFIEQTALETMKPVSNLIISAILNAIKK